MSLPTEHSPAGPSPDTWAMIVHLSSFVGYLGNAVGCIVGPLAVWLFKKDELPLVDHHGKEALNFNISIALYTIGFTVFAFVTFGLGLVIAIPGLLVLWIFHAVCTILAAIKANNHEPFRYPLTIRLLK